MAYTVRTSPRVRIHTWHLSSVTRSTISSSKDARDAPVAQLLEAKCPRACPSRRRASTRSPSLLEASHCRLHGHRRRRLWGPLPARVDPVVAGRRVGRVPRVARRPSCAGHRQRPRCACLNCIIGEIASTKPVRRRTMCRRQPRSLTLCARIRPSRADPSQRATSGQLCPAEASGPVRPQMLTVFAKV